MQITVLKKRILKSNLLKGSFFYFFISLLNTTIPFVILPIVSRVLSLTNFGDYSLYKVFLAFSIPFVGMAISASVMRRFYSLGKEEFKSYLFTAILPILISLFFWVLTINIFKYQLIEVLKINSINLVYLGLISGAVNSLYNIVLTVYRAKNQFIKYFIINISFILLYLLIIVIFYFSDRLTLNIIIYGYIFSYFIGWLIGLFFLFKDRLIVPIIRFNQIADMLKYSFPIALYSLVALIYGLNDKLIINSYLTKEDLAIFAGTSQVAFILSKVGYSIQLAWTPFVFEQYEKFGIKTKRVKKYTLIIVGFLIITALFFTILYPFIYRLFLPQRYSVGLKFYYFFILASLFQSIYWLFNPYILYVEKNKYLLYISIISVIISLSLNFYFVHWGLFFVAMVFAISWFVQLVCLLIIIYYVKNFKSNI